jgi:hypothetical protein
MAIRKDVIPLSFDVLHVLGIKSPGKGTAMTAHYKLRVLTLMTAAGCAAALLLPAPFDGSGARAQVSAPPTGHRQPRAGDIPNDQSQQTKRSPEDIALERALNNICKGCSPIIPVRDVPRYDIARTCPGGDGTETCRNDEERARQVLQQQWPTFTDKARSDCVQTNEIGGRPSYVQLGICLKTTQIAPTLPEGR